MDTYGAAAEDNKPVMVQATVTSVHDRLPPYEGHNIGGALYVSADGRLQGQGGMEQSSCRNRIWRYRHRRILWGWKLCTRRGWPACSMEGPRRSSELRSRVGNACKRAPSL